jgi:hypothetical protein
MVCRINAWFWVKYVAFLQRLPQAKQTAGTRTYSDHLAECAVLEDGSEDDRDPCPTREVVGHAPGRHAVGGA